MSERKIVVTVKPNSRAIEIEKISDQVYKVKLTVTAQEGKANKQLIEVMADYFSLSKSQVTIKSGLSSREKVLIIYG
ncbi:MAG: DUF167 domain-containing protein [bacterium]